MSKVVKLLVAGRNTSAQSAWFSHYPAHFKAFHLSTFQCYKDFDMIHLNVTLSFPVLCYKVLSFSFWDIIQNFLLFQQTATQKGKKIAASFRFHFKSGSWGGSRCGGDDDDDDVGDSTATDDDLRSNMARSITLWGGIIIPSGAHLHIGAHWTLLHIYTLVHIGNWCTFDIGAICCTFVHPQHFYVLS